MSTLQVFIVGWVERNETQPTLPLYDLNVCDVVGQNVEN